MYTFTIKDNSPDINLVVTRSLLALAGVASLVYRSNQNIYINIIAGTVLIAAAVFISRLLVKYKMNSRLLLCIAALILFAATHSIPFAAILVLCGLLVQLFYVAPLVHVNTEGIMLKKMFGNPLHSWDEFNNIVLKDNLLTLDFKNNKLLQLTIIDKENKVDEGSFNNFCSGFIGV